MGLRGVEGGRGGGTGLKVVAAAATTAPDRGKKGLERNNWKTFTSRRKKKYINFNTVLKVRPFYAAAPGKNVISSECIFKTFELDSFLWNILFYTLLQDKFKSATTSGGLLNPEQNIFISYSRPLKG